MRDNNTGSKKDDVLNNKRDRMVGDQLNNHNSTNLIQSNGSRNYSRLQQKLRDKYTNKVNNTNLVNSNAATNSFHNVMGSFDKIKNNNSLAIINQQKINKNIQFGGYVNEQMLDFVSPLKMVRPFQQQNANPSNPKKNSNEVPSNQKILVEKTVQKPKFGFKKQQNESISNQTTNTDDEIISFQNSSIAATKRINQSGVSLNESKSANNFSDVLKIEQNKINVKRVKNGILQGYIINNFDKKQEHLTKKLQQIRKNNELFDQKIKQKQREIELIKKRVQKQQKQFNNYQQKMILAYDNVTQNPDSLLISSRNYEVSNKQMQARIQNRIKVKCNFEGMTKKLCKQILYGKCMILDNDLLKVGFDNQNRGGSIQLYFTVKEDLLEMQVSFQNFLQNGFTFNDQPFQMKINNIQAGKKIKAKTKLKYVGTLQDKVGFISLKIVMKININSIFTQQITLPFCLYKNFITQVIPQNSKSTPNRPRQLERNETKKYIIVSEWQNCCDQFIKNPKSYLETLFNNKTGKWVQENVFNIDLMFKHFQKKSINILINCRNFAIEMTDTNNMEIVLTIGNFLTRFRQDKQSRLSRLK